MAGHALSFDGVAFTENVVGSADAPGVGGAIHLTGPTTEPSVLLRSTFVRNRAERPAADFTAGHGGAVYAGYPITGSGFGSVALLNTAFLGNVAAGNGGALYLNDEFPNHSRNVRLVNALFVGNHATQRGGAIFDQAVHAVRLHHSTLVANEAGLRGQAFHRPTESSPLMVYNSIVWGHSGTTSTPFGATTGLWNSLADFPPGSETSFIDVVAEDPLFVRAPSPGPDGVWGTIDDDYGDLRLTESSPGLLLGNATFLPADTFDLDGDGNTTEPLPIDLAGEARVQGSAPNAGAYEGAALVSAEVDASRETLSLTVAPTPFRDRTTLHLTLPASGPVRVVVYDVLGREVLRVIDAEFDAGSHAVPLDGRTLANGTYLVRVETARESSTQRITRVR